MNGLESISAKCLEQLSFYIKIFIILYADKVIMSETAEGLQQALLNFEQYCDLWKLKVNTQKKFAIFSKRKYKAQRSFKLYDENIDIVDLYTYLGVVLNYNGNYCTAKKRLIDQANKALYALYYKLRNLTILIDLQLKLFDSLIAPILVYSCEIWGFENKQGIEKLHLQCLKKILDLRNNTPNYMVYGEMDRFPMDIVIKLRMVMFWNSLIDNSGKLSSILHKTYAKNTRE